MTGIYGAFRRINATTRPEESLLLRGAVLAAVMLAVAAAGLSGATPAGDTLLALLLLPVGAVISHRRRDSDNTLIKVALTIAAAVALARFFGDVRIATTIEDTRQPLASLFLALQILHGFDLPQRRDLGFSLASSLALVALAGVNTHAGIFGVLVVAYAAVAAISMAAMQRSAAAEIADTARTAHPRGVAWTGGNDDVDATGLVRGRPSAALRAVSSSGWGLVRATSPVLLVGLLVFLLLPRTDTGTIGRLPFQGITSPQLPSSFVTNPGLEGDGQQSPDQREGSPLPFNPTAYFGFSEYVDLRTVGELSEEPIMRVRADRPRFWRGMVFDVYDGTGWSRSQEEAPAPTHGQPVRLPRQWDPAPEGGTPAGHRSERVVQTFELLGDTPNLIFGAAAPREIYLAGGSANRWDDGTITTGTVMEDGTIYSVVSEVTLTPPEILRERTGAVPTEIHRRYTRLPPELPQRVRDLSADLTAGATTPYAKAEAIEEWIADNTTYTLDAPPPPRDGDLVDHFLFEARRGWCEPIASSMVVLLRASGIPARFATGFQPGQRNPITGVWDVTMADAHAWVEVWIPREGWISLDPTGAVPAAVDGRDVSSIPLLELLSAGAAAISGPLGAAARHGGAAAGVLGGLVVLLAAAAAARRARRRDLSDVGATPFEELARLLAEHGLPRDAWQTPREYVERIRLQRPDLPQEPLDVLRAAAERRRYARPGPPDRSPATVRERAALAAIDRHVTAGDDVRERSEGTGARVVRGRDL